MVHYDWHRINVASLLQSERILPQRWTTGLVYQQTLTGDVELSAEIIVTEYL